MTHSIDDTATVTFNMDLAAVQEADLEIVGSATVRETTAGSALTNLVTGTNHGPDLARDVLITQTLVSTGYDPSMPVSFALHQNYPNSFNPETTIRFDVSEPASVLLRAYDVLGNEVTTITDRAYGPGQYTLTFGAGGFPTGTYVYRIQMGDFRDVKKMVLMK